MIDGKKAVKRRKLSRPDEIKKNLEYWLSKTSEERIAEVERLRREHYGTLPRMEKVVRIINMRTGEVIRTWPQNLSDHN